VTLLLLLLKDWRVWYWNDEYWM